MMHSLFPRRARLAAPLLALLVACGAEPATTPAESPQPASPDPTTPTDTLLAGLQYSGSLISDDGTEHHGPGSVEISAPILPTTNVLYANEGQSYPTTLAGAQDVAHRASLLYDKLLVDCKAKYPNITLRRAGAPALTPAQLAQNYASVSLCAYEVYQVKPYWMLQLVNDVDICGRELGAGWRLPTEADLRGFSPADYQFFERTLSAPSGAWLAYFTLDILVRGSDGSIQIGSLAAAPAARLSPAPAACRQSPKDHCERQAFLSLRCLRTTKRP